MACEGIHSWTLSTLISAFLDLSITYLLLCASTLVFFTSKFLSLFKLHLPCPCSTGLFTDPNTICTHKLLLDNPITTISSVQKSVRNSFPFDSILLNDHQNRNFIAKLDDYEGLGECEASCSSLSDGNLQKKKNELVRFGSGNSRKEPRIATFRRRRMSRRASSQSPFSNSRMGQAISESDASSVPSEAPQHDSVAHIGRHSDEGFQHSFKWNEFGRDESSASDVVRNVVERENGLEQGDVNTVRILEQALEEEHAARAVLYQELEKERSAAASAADEAMAMILRLQKEKASTEMESRQYQRMIEEKSVYDQEEMNILKEILLRREREKLFLEKEVEAYRQMMASVDEEVVGMSTQRPFALFDSSEDPAMMLQQISEYIDKKQMVKNMRSSTDYESVSVERYGRTLDFGEEVTPIRPEIASFLNRGDGESSKKDNRHHQSYEKYHAQGPENIEDSSQELQVKRYLPVELVVEADSVFHKVSGPEELDSVEKTIVVDEEPVKNDNAAQQEGMIVKNDHTREPKILSPCDALYQEKHENGTGHEGLAQHETTVEADPTVHDVHVIESNMKLPYVASEKSTESLSGDTVTDSCKKFGPPSESSGSMNVDPTTDFLCTSTGKTQPVISRSLSDMRSVLDIAQRTVSLSDMRRNSISAVDYERIKLESEVGWLRERLKIVQEGREKLSFSVEHREREKVHLQLLEGIANQLREIRQLTEPGKAVRQASLPPSSSKASSKKRRCRSVSLGLRESN